MTLFLAVLAAYLYGSFVTWWTCRHRGATFHYVDEGIDLDVLGFAIVWAWFVMPLGYAYSFFFGRLPWEDRS